MPLYAKIENDKVVKIISCSKSNTGSFLTNGRWIIIPKDKSVLKGDVYDSTINEFVSNNEIKQEPVVEEVSAPVKKKKKTSKKK